MEMTPPDVKIRGLYKKDTEQLLHMIQASGGDFTAETFRGWMMSAFGGLDPKGPQTRVFVAEDTADEGKLHGYIAYTIDRSQGERRFAMNDCFVWPDVRRNGIGTKLLYGMISGGPMQEIRVKIADAIACLQAPKGMPKWTSTDTQIADDNADALAFLTSRGFRNDGNTADDKIKLTFDGDE